MRRCVARSALRAGRPLLSFAANSAQVAPRLCARDLRVRLFANQSILALPVRLTLREANAKFVEPPKWYEVPASSSDEAHVPSALETVTGNSCPVTRAYLPFTVSNVSVCSYTVSGQYGIRRLSTRLEYVSDGKGGGRYETRTYVETDWFSFSNAPVPACHYADTLPSTQLYAGFEFPRRRVEAAACGAYNASVSLARVGVDEATHEAQIRDESATFRTPSSKEVEREDREHDPRVRGWIVHTHAERSAISKERLMHAVTDLERARATHWAKEHVRSSSWHGRYDELRLTEFSVPFSRSVISMRSIHVPFYVWQQQQQQPLTQQQWERASSPFGSPFGAQYPFHSSLQGLVCASSGKCDRLKRVSGVRVGLATALSALSSAVLVRALAAGTATAMATLRESLVLGAGAGVCASVASIVYPMWRAYSDQRTLFEDRAYNATMAPNRVDTERARIGAQHAGTEPIAASDAEDATDALPALDQPLRQALLVLGFDPENVQRTNLTLEQLVARRNECIQESHPDKIGNVDVRAAAERTRACLEAYSLVRARFEASPVPSPPSHSS